MNKTFTNIRYRSGRKKKVFAGIMHDEQAKAFTQTWLEGVSKTQPAEPSDWGKCPICNRKVSLTGFVEIDGLNTFNLMTKPQTVPKLVCSFCDKVFLWIQMQRTTVNQNGGILTTHWIEVYLYDPKKQMYIPFENTLKTFVMS
jgi:hypothetical protein